jgi:hypothetical protein
MEEAGCIRVPRVETVEDVEGANTPYNISNMIRGANTANAGREVKRTKRGYKITTTDGRTIEETFHDGVPVIEDPKQLENITPSQLVEFPAYKKHFNELRNQGINEKAAHYAAAAHVDKLLADNQRISVIRNSCFDEKGNSSVEILEGRAAARAMANNVLVALGEDYTLSPEVREKCIEHMKNIRDCKDFQCFNEEQAKLTKILDRKDVHFPLPYFTETMTAMGGLMMGHVVGVPSSKTFTVADVIMWERNETGTLVNVEFSSVKFGPGGGAGAEGRLALTAFRSLRNKNGRFTPGSILRGALMRLTRTDTGGSANLWTYAYEDPDRMDHEEAVSQAVFDEMLPSILDSYGVKFEDLSPEQKDIYGDELKSCWQNNREWGGPEKGCIGKGTLPKKAKTDECQRAWREWNFRGSLVAHLSNRAQISDRYTSWIWKPGKEIKRIDGRNEGTSLIGKAKRIFSGFKFQSIKNTRKFASGCHQPDSGLSMRTVENERED